MRGLGKIDKNNVQKNVEKRGKSEQKFIKMRAFLAKMSKN